MNSNLQKRIRLLGATTEQIYCFSDNKAIVTLFIMVKDIRSENEILRDAFHSGMEKFRKNIFAKITCQLEGEIIVRATTEAYYVSENSGIVECLGMQTDDSTDEQMMFARYGSSANDEHGWAIIEEIPFVEDNILGVDNHYGTYGTDYQLISKQYFNTFIKNSFEALNRKYNTELSLTYQKLNFEATQRKQAEWDEEEAQILAIEKQVEQMRSSGNFGSAPGNAMIKGRRFHRPVRI